MPFANGRWSGGNKSVIMEYEAGLLKAWPKPSTSLYTRSSQNAVLDPMPARAAFQMKHPMTMMLRRLLLSAARPMKSPVTTKVAEKPSVGVRDRREERS